MNSLNIPMQKKNLKKNGGIFLFFGGLGCTTLPENLLNLDCLVIKLNVQTFSLLIKFQSTEGVLLCSIVEFICHCLIPLDTWVIKVLLALLERRYYICVRLYVTKIWWCLKLNYQLWCYKLLRLGVLILPRKFILAFRGGGWICLNDPWN